MEIASYNQPNQQQLRFNTGAGGNSVLSNSNSKSKIASFVRRVRTPSSTDVLSGRGGSVNQHPGNIQFRLWVNERKHDYNLAKSKVDKAMICREVIARVTSSNPPGKFLARDEMNSSFWIELDDERIMAKTSQALREGAPKIREEHQFEQKVAAEQQQQNHAKKRRQRSSMSRLSYQPQAETSSHPAGSAMEQIPVKMPSFRMRGAPVNATAFPISTTFQENGSAMTPVTQRTALQLSTIYGSSISPEAPQVPQVPQTRLSSSVITNNNTAAKRVRLEYNGREVRPNDASPPLIPKATTTLQIQPQHYSSVDSDIPESLILPTRMKQQETSSDYRISGNYSNSYYYHNNSNDKKNSLQYIINDDDAATPPLTSLPGVAAGTCIEEFSLSLAKNAQLESEAPSGGRLKRCHSLALSEVDSTSDLAGYDFVNPFENENEGEEESESLFASSTSLPSSKFDENSRNVDDYADDLFTPPLSSLTNATVGRIDVPRMPSRIGVLRECSTNSNGDFGGLRALMRGGGWSSSSSTSFSAAPFTVGYERSDSSGSSSTSSCSSTSNSSCEISDDGNAKIGMVQSCASPNVRATELNNCDNEAVTFPTTSVVTSTPDNTLMDRNYCTNTAITTTNTAVVASSSIDVAARNCSDWDEMNESSVNSSSKIDLWWAENGGAYADLDVEIPVPMPVSP